MRHLVKPFLDNYGPAQVVFRARPTEAVATRKAIFGHGICLGAHSRYRVAVPYTRLLFRGRAPLATTTLSLACALALSACAGSTPRATSASSLAPASTQPLPDEAAAAYWWRSAGDPILAHLVEAGLLNDRSLACQALALNRANDRAHAHARHITTKIGRIFDTRGTDVAAAEEAARAYRYADHRAALAARIALAYIETRRLQETLVARTSALDASIDNAEIAAFRREAGLVSGVDTGLADSALAAGQDDTEAVHSRYAESRDALARLVGMPSEDLQDLLGEAGTVPDLGAAPPPETTSADIAHRADLLALERSLIAHLIETKVSQDQLDDALAEMRGKSAAPAIDPDPARAAIGQWRKSHDEALEELAKDRDRLAISTQRQTDLEAAIGKARETVKDARLAYRTGTGDFAALYVAEEATRKLEESRISARAERAVASVRNWTDQGLGWTDADLTPPPPPADGPEVLVCD